MDKQQLIKKNQSGSYQNIYPKTFIDAIRDKESGMSLSDILNGFNMYFLPYVGSPESTRLLVPKLLRRQGLWITYVKYDKTVVTEWYAGEDISDTAWKNSSNWRIGNNNLVGDITISSDGNWVVNGEDTGVKAQGEPGITPLLRIYDNKLQVSYTNGTTYININDTPVYTEFREEGNKLQQSTDLGQTWTDISDYIAAWFRMSATSASTAGDKICTIQISRDEGKTWSNLGESFTNSLHIKDYVSSVGSLPSGAANGDIYGVGPTYDTSDSEHTNPIYNLYVKTSSGWVDNGRFTSIAAGIVQETGSDENSVMSQKATTEKLTELEYNDIKSRVIALSNIKGYSKTSEVQISSQDTEGVTIEDNKIILSSGIHKVFRIGIKEKNTKDKSIFGFLILKSNVDITQFGSFYKVNVYGKELNSDGSYYFYVPYDKSYNSFELGFQSEKSFTIRSQVEIEYIDGILSSCQLIIDDAIINSLSDKFREFPFNKIVYNENYKINYRIDHVTGDETPQAGYLCSDYIEIETGKSYKSISGFGFWATYDSNKTYKRGGISSDSSTIITIKDGEAYIRVSTSFNYVLENGFGFSENSIFGNNLPIGIIVNGIQNIRNVNLFNPKNIVYDKYLKQGVESSAAGWYCSEYIEVNGYTELFGYFGYYAFYTAEKEVILSGLTYMYSHIDVPANAMYIRISNTATASYGAINPWDMVISPYPFSGYINDGFTVKNKLWYRVLDAINHELNLFTFDNFVKDKYINSANGGLKDSINWVTTDYIEVAPNNIYSFAGYYAWYDSDKSFVSGGLDLTFTSKKAPSNAKYLRTSFPAYSYEQHLDLAVTEGTRSNPIRKLISILSKNDDSNIFGKQIVVDINGEIGVNCDFTDIESAMQSIVDSSETNQYEIFVKNGTYTINSSYINIKDYVIVTGESKTGVKIYKETLTGDQNCVCFDPAGQNINFAKIQNLTMICKGGKCCVHSDGKSSISNNGKLIIDNCIMQYISLNEDMRYYKSGVNLGLHSGQTVEVTNCQGDVLLYMHSSVNPNDVQNPSYFIVRNCNVLSIGAYDIANKNNNYFIAENNKADYIGIGVSSLSNNPNNMALICDVNNNDVEWVYLMKHGEGTDWYQSYPVCVNSIHRYCENYTGETIQKGTFVSKDYISKYGDQPFNIPTITPYQEGKQLVGIAMEDIANDSAGVIQFAGKIPLDETTYNVGDYLTLSSIGQLEVGTKENAIGFVCSKDKDTNKCWFKFVE